MGYVTCILCIDAQVAVHLLVVKGCFFGVLGHDDMWPGFFFGLVRWLGVVVVSGESRVEGGKLGLGGGFVGFEEKVGLKFGLGSRISGG